MSSVKPRTQRHVLEGYDEWVHRAGDAPAVTFSDQTVTYRELDDRANRLAWALRERGCGADTVVGLAVRRGIDLAVSVLGVLKA